MTTINMEKRLLLAATEVEHTVGLLQREARVFAYQITQAVPIGVRLPDGRASGAQYMHRVREHVSGHGKPVTDLCVWGREEHHEDGAWVPFDNWTRQEVISFMRDIRKGYLKLLAEWMEETASVCRLLMTEPPADQGNHLYVHIGDTLQDLRFEICYSAVEGHPGIYYGNYKTKDEAAEAGSQAISSLQHALQPRQ